MKGIAGRPDPPARTGIDWTALHLRIAEAERALSRSGTADPEAVRAILRERAKALARAPQPQRAEGEGVDLVEFRLAEESYALEARFVREVRTVRGLTPLPGAPPFVAGITAARGQILTVLDGRKLFGLAPGGAGPLTVIVVSAGGIDLGLLADEVTAMRSILPGEIGPAPITSTGARAAYLRGVTADACIVLDAQRLLSDPKIIVREEIESREAGR